MRVFRLWGWLFRKRELVPFAAAARPDFLLLSPEKVEGDVLYEDGWVRVTPAFVEVGGAKKIVVSKIRELRKGLVRQDGLCGVIYRLLLILFINGTVISGLFQSWLWFALCLGCGVMTCLEGFFQPYFLSIHFGRGMGEYLLFPSPGTRGACELAIEHAIEAEK